ncbi:hypothetical protein EMPS_06436 [Entomortierella parvispora]|uniref:Protein kinase domain-containing protein n=1 Tax=Entomortierella parvispora TaxID=205924 RepID=A0A9P3LXH0_9FUNG|nr:hypothetical protein EMPS_06436 [Entomortierella parvispora]
MASTYSSVSSFASPSSGSGAKYFLIENKTTGQQYRVNTESFASGAFSSVHKGIKWHENKKSRDKSEEIYAVKRFQRGDFLAKDLPMLTDDIRATMSAHEIKEFEQTRAMNEQKLLEQPLRECFAVKKLHGHPYFLTFVDACYAPDYVFLVTELARGGDLQRRFDNMTRPFTEETLIPMVRTICDAIKTMHSDGIVHRDLKPLNILFRSKTNDDLIVADFGLSNFLEERGFFTTDCGTQMYKAPEQSQGQQYGSPVDMWALGKMCYHLLTREIPNESERPLFWEGFSPEARDFMQRLIVQNPQERMTAEQARAHPWLSLKEI